MRVEAAMEMGQGILRWAFGVSVASFGGGIKTGVILSVQGIIKTGNTYWNVMHVRVERTDWAARWVVPK